jgi:hypothetical protein
MLPRSEDNPWIRRTKGLTQALIISGTLNIGLIATFAYFFLKDKQDALALEHKPASNEIIPSKEGMNIHSLRSYFLLPYQELLLRLENQDLLEEGLTKRDLALACLVAFHHFNLDKALGGLSVQKRTISFANNAGQETIDVPVFPGLADEQFQAILQYAKTEKWPLTSQGLFYELKRSPTLRDSSLLDTFYLSPEYHAVHTLLARTGLNPTREQVIDLICEGEWNLLSALTEQQRICMDLTVERRRLFLLDYLNHRSKVAAKFFLEADLDFSLKRLNDAQILTLFDLYGEKNATLANFSKELLASPRTDAVWQRAAATLFSSLGESLPDPYDHQAVLQRFFPQMAFKPSEEEPSRTIMQIHTPILQPSSIKLKKQLHTVEQGENLWKIARKYRVSIEELMRVNHMDTEKLRPGKQLEIPEKRGEN